MQTAIPIADKKSAVVTNQRLQRPLHSMAKYSLHHSGKVVLAAVVLLLLSGLVIDLGSFPDALAAAVSCLPSTALAELLRAQLADGAAGPAWAWGCLGAWTVAAAAAAIRWFRWE